MIAYERLAVRTSTDGHTWEEVDVTELPAPFCCISAGYGSGAFDNTIWFSQDAEDQPERLWVLEFLP